MIQMGKPHQGTQFFLEIRLIEENTPKLKSEGMASCLKQNITQGR